VECEVAEKQLLGQVGEGHFGQHFGGQLHAFALAGPPLLQDAVSLGGRYQSNLSQESLQSQLLSIRRVKFIMREIFKPNSDRSEN